MKVLYIIGAVSDLTVPLEVAELIEAKDLDLTVASYYRTEGTETSLYSGHIRSVEARGRLDLRAIRRLYALIREVDPHVIHVHHTLSAFLGSLIGRLVGVPAVVKTEHNDHRHYKAVQKIMTTPILALVDRVICNSDHTQASFYPWERWLADHKAVTVYNGVNTKAVQAWSSRAEGARHALCDELDFDARTDFLLGSVGRLIEQKNYETLISAMKHVRREQPNVKLLVAGDGPLRGRLEERIRALGVQDQIVLMGEVPRERVYRTLYALDAFVMPSRWEGFCNAAVEAMSAGCPVLCSDIETLREVIGEAGLFFDPHAPRAITDAILAVAREDPTARSERGARNRRRAEQTLTMDDAADEYCRHYRELLA